MQPILDMLSSIDTFFHSARRGRGDGGRLDGRQHRVRSRSKVGPHPPCRGCGSGKSARVVEGVRHEFHRRPESILLTGRFVPVARVAVNMTAGASRLPYRRFLLLSLASASAWACVSVTIAVLVGAFVTPEPLLATTIAVMIALVGGDRSRSRHSLEKTRSPAERERMSTVTPPRWRSALRVLERSGPPRPFAVVGWITVGAMAVGLFWLSVPTLVALYDLTLPIAFALSSLQCVTLPFVIRFPRSAMLLHVACIVLIGTFTRDSMIDGFWPVPVANLLTLASILILLGLREDWVIAVSAWWLSFLAMTVVVVLNSNALSTESEWGVDVLVSVTVTLIALVVSIFIGQRGRVRETLAAAKRDVELEQARRETVEERARIARELHDVVAHSMSIVHIQAESAGYRVNDLDGARAEFTDIARSARSALGEMRRLLQALHPDDGGTLYAPQPTIGDIPELVAGAEKVGSPVTFESDVEAGTVSPVIELTAYRIVQEALSNVIRHAPHASVGVLLHAGTDVVEVSVHNSAPPHGHRIGRSSTPSGGHGLRGMRERVALVQGDIEQIPLPDGGFLITARLPTTRQKDIE